MSEIQQESAGGLVTLEEAAQFFACEVTAIRKWIAEERLPSVKIGRLRRVRRSDLEKIAITGLPPGRK